VVRSQAGVRQRCRCHWVDFSESHQTARGHCHIFRHPTVAAEADSQIGVGRSVLAVGVLTARASATAATPDGAVDEVSITFSQPVDSRTELFDPARLLMTEDERRRNSTGTALLEFVVDGNV